MADNRKRGIAPEPPNSMMLRRTLKLLAVCGIVAFAVLLVRLFWLQIVEHDKYESGALEYQVRDTQVNAARGTIYDTNMKILAMSATVYDVYISPKEIEMYGEDPEDIAKNLSEILGVDYDMVLEKTTKNNWYQTIARKVEPELSDAVREYKNANDLKGVKLEENSKRYYPYSSMAAQVIGFTNIDNDGSLGVEAQYNDLLTGIDGRVVRAKNAVGTDMLFTNFEDYYDSEDGKDVVLTIDATIQYYLEKHLKQAASDYNVRNGAACIAMDVDTGAILGMVSLGDFDLNNYQLIAENYQTVVDETVDDPSTEANEQDEALNKYQQLQWRNKAISDTYEPGSVFKIITLSMALNEGAVSENDSFYCGGSLKVQGDTEPRSCWNKTGHGTQTLTQSLQHSCNVAFMEIGLKLGAEKFYEYAEAFGLFDAPEEDSAMIVGTGKTGIDLGGESGSFWWSHDVFCDKNNKSQLAAASFGQTFNITPLQLITAVSACVNGGYLMQPYVVREVVNADGTVESSTEPTVRRQVISEQTSAKVMSMLEQVVGDRVEGTGKNAYVAGYRIGGKTGTSEKVAHEAQTGAKEYIVSFLGVAPAEDPKIAILMLLDNPDPSTGYVSGGQMAAPTVGKMMSDILPYMGYEPSYTTDEKAAIDHSVPDIGGMTLEEAQNALTASGFTYRVIGAGGTVTNQLPAANAVAAAESQVIIYADAEPSGSQEVMPDLTGLSYSIARQRMGAYALYIRSTKAVVDPTGVVVTKQSIAPGTAIDHGTVVTVEVSDTTSNLGRY